MSEFCGACCSDVEIVLTAEEHQQLQDAGTEFSQDPVLEPPLGCENSWSSPQGQAEIMRRVLLASKIGDTPGMSKWIRIGNVAKTMVGKEGLYEMIGRCGNLAVDNSCIGYQIRPSICREFKPGSQDCLRLREGIPLPLSETPVEILKLR